MSYAVRVPLGMLAVLAAACAQSTPGAPGPLAPVPREAWPEAFVRANCQSQLRGCWSGDAADIAWHERISVETCVAQAMANPDFPGLFEQMTADAVRYDGALAARCAEQFASTCWTSLLFDMDPFEGFPACRDAFVGTLLERVACRSTFECAPDLWCDRGGAPDVCGGVCRPRLAVGAPCDEDAQCVRPGGGQFANCTGGFLSSTPPVCAATTLVIDASEGEPCDVLGDPPGEQQMVICARGLDCADPDASDLSPQRRCLAPLPPGAPCYLGKPCAAGYACLPQTDLSRATCEPLVIAAEGELCDDMRGSPQCDPAAPLTCRDGRCAILPVVGESVACEDSIGVMARCADGLWCMSDTQRCEAPRPIGGGCHESQSCAAGFCDFDTGTGLCADPALVCP